MARPKTGVVLDAQLRSRHGTQLGEAREMCLIIEASVLRPIGRLVAQDHIAAFGGDPQRVLLAGQSAGAGSVSAHLVAPGNRYLSSICRHTPSA